MKMTREPQNCPRPGSCPLAGLGSHDLDVAEKLGRVLHATDRIQRHIEGLSTRMANVEDAVRPLSDLVSDVEKLKTDTIEAKIDRNKLRWMWLGGGALLVALSGGLTVWFALVK